MGRDGRLTLRLTSELEQLVREEVRRGAFGSSSEYIGELLRERLLKERERRARLEALDAALARGIADAEAGRVLPIGDAFHRIRAEPDLSDESSAG